MAMPLGFVYTERVESEHENAVATWMGSYTNHD